MFVHTLLVPSRHIFVVIAHKLPMNGLCIGRMFVDKHTGFQILEMYYELENLQLHKLLLNID